MKSAVDLIPGARETALLTTFGSAGIPMTADEPTTMDAATIAERQREGGGAPSQRRPAAERLWFSRLRHTLQQFLASTRPAASVPRVRTNHP
jgi:hypothetical protein